MAELPPPLRNYIALGYRGQYGNGVGRCTVGIAVLPNVFFFLPQMIYYTAFPTISLQLVACMWDRMEKQCVRFCIRPNKISVL